MLLTLCRCTHNLCHKAIFGVNYLEFLGGGYADYYIAYESSI